MPLTKVEARSIRPGGNLHFSVATDACTMLDVWRASMTEPPPERLASLSSRNELRGKVDRLRAVGPRETASPEHVSFVDWISGELASLGVQVRRDSHKFDRWSVSASDCALLIHDAAHGNLEIPVASAYPYSGRTGPLGISGQLQFVRCTARWSGVAGKIAVVEVPHPSVASAPALQCVRICTGL